MPRSALVRPNVAAMHGYAPGEQPRAGERVVKLNTNELPYGPSPRVLDALRDATADGEALRRYPSPTAEPFRRAAAKLHKLDAESVICGNGSDDLLNLAVRAFVPPGGALATPTPTYSLYPTLAQIEDAKHVAVPWDDGWALPAAALLKAKADAVFFANPNSPSGTLVAVADVRAFAEKFDGVVLVDEAYVDFAPSDAACVDLVRDGLPNVIVSRTLSKGYGLAGLRFGYALAPAALVEQLMKVKDSYNCDALSIVAACAALDDQAYARNCWGRVADERDRLAEELKAVGFDVPMSHANFLFARVPDGEDARALQLGLRQQGILVRHFDLPELGDRLRVTVGTAQENDALLAGLKQLLPALQPA